MNAYELLECSKTSSQDEIKQSYHKLLLLHHPDKSTNQNIDNFLKIQSAYKILSNTTERGAYDSLLKQLELKQIGSNLEDYEFLNDDGENMFLLSLKKDFDFDAESNEYKRKCRCGSLYKIKDKDLYEFFNISNDGCSVSANSFVVGLECDTCSLVINVLVI
ncbi:unnamed protein product [Brachionus calyciflorus]|uniref:Diphthamide biosynthesis protein 4 n=1 Tax=Brachionus calyciflorus TaxID=104777 RepID=A0A814EX17_9BILA|nr:unnamed protein product [Brachionus calyciflorus]